MLNSKKKKISHPKENHLAKKFARFGPEALSDAELLAILCADGQEVRILPVNKTSLNGAGLFSHYCRFSLRELTAEFGYQQAVRLKACFEISRRMQKESQMLKHRFKGRGKIIDSAKAVYKFVAPKILGCKKVHFIVLPLDTFNRLLGFDSFALGSFDSGMLFSDQIFQSAAKYKASSVILVHNHPEGDATPSADEIAISRRLFAKAKKFKIDVFDHVIVAGGEYLSLKQSNLV